MENAAAPSIALASDAPGPQGGMLAQLRLMREDPLGFLESLPRLYGDVARLKLVFRVYLLTNPDHLREVFDAKTYKDFPKGRLYERIRPLIGDGLLSSDGEFWVRQRKRAQKAFTSEDYAYYGAVMAEEAAWLVDRWDRLASTEEPFDVHADMSRVALRVVGRTLLGTDVDSDASEVGRALTEVLRILNDRFQRVVVMSWLPTPTNIRFRRALGTLERVVRRIIAEKHAQPPGRDLLSRFIEARDDDGRGMSDRQLRDETMTMFLAGHETTANALSWAVHLLTRNPAAAEKLRREADRVLGGRPAAMADLPDLSYAKMVVQEAMRLYPPVWLMGRIVKEDRAFGGVRVRKGSVVFASPYVTHRDPRLWPDPTRFDPERFSKEASIGRHDYAYFPFAAGPRKCIGDRFAMMEAVLILATVAGRYVFHAADDRTVVPDPAVTLRPKDGIMARLTLR